jgi:hypothetical protein
MIVVFSSGLLAGSADIFHCARIHDDEAPDQAHDASQVYSNLDREKEIPRICSWIWI